MVMYGSPPQYHHLPLRTLLQFQTTTPIHKSFNFLSAVYQSMHLQLVCLLPQTRVSLGGQSQLPNYNGGDFDFKNFLSKSIVRYEGIFIHDYIQFPHQMCDFDQNFQPQIKKISRHLLPNMDKYIYIRNIYDQAYTAQAFIPN